MNYNDHALADLQVYPMNHLHQMVEHSQRHRRASARYAIASLRVLPVHLRLPSLVNPSLLGGIELYMVNASRQHRYLQQILSPYVGRIVSSIVIGYHSIEVEVNISVIGS